MTLGHARHPDDPPPSLGGVLDIPRSARLAAWGTAWLQGRASVGRAVVRAVTGDDEPHCVEPGDVRPPAADL